MARSSTTSKIVSKPTARAAAAAKAREDAAVAAAPASDSNRCACGESVVRIDLLIDGDEITMVSCSNCDRRSWHRGGKEVELDGVLADISSVPTRYRRDLASR
jgi:hypothetical protein